VKGAFFITHFFPSGAPGMISRERSLRLFSPAHERMNGQMAKMELHQDDGHNQDNDCADYNDKCSGLADCPRHLRVA
jgi:hypothetical protein